VCFLVSHVPGDVKKPQIHSNVARKRTASQTAVLKEKKLKFTMPHNTTQAHFLCTPGVSSKNTDTLEQQVVSLRESLTDMFQCQKYIFLLPRITGLCLTLKKL